MEFSKTAQVFERVLKGLSRLAIPAGVLIAVAASAYESQHATVTSFGGNVAGNSHGMLSTGGLAAGGESSGDIEAGRAGYLFLFGRPALSATAATIDFGNVDDAVSRTDSVQLSNFGGTTLFLSAFRFVSESSAFEIDRPAGDILIGPGSTQSISISFEPSGSGEERDTLLADTNDPSNPVWALSLHGSSQAFSVTVTAQGDTVPVDSPITIVARSSLTPDSGRVHYRLGGEGPASYRSIAMLPAGEDSISATIPARDVLLRGVEFYAEIHANGKSVKSPAGGSEDPSKIAAAVTGAGSPGWNARQHRMISVPMSTFGENAGALFTAELGVQSADTWRLGRWSSQEARTLEYPGELGADLDGGNAFWIITSEAKSFRASGVTLFPEAGDTVRAIRMEGRDGESAWTQIANPFAYDVSWADCLVEVGGVRHSLVDAANSGIIENAAYEWTQDEGSGEYGEAARLEPWRGYFVNNLSGEAIDLLIPAHEAESRKNEAPAGDPTGGDSWKLIIAARSNDRTGKVTVGRQTGALAGPDAWDRSDPPTPGGTGSLLAIRHQDSRVLSTDIRPVTGETETWELRLDTGPGELVDLLARQTEVSTTPEPVWIVDPATGKHSLLRPEEPFQVRGRVDGSGLSIRLIAGGANFDFPSDGASDSSPETLALSRPYPNPFRVDAHFRYAIPGTGPVRLGIYDVGGRLVRDLAPTGSGPGFHIADWDGRNRNGKSAAPGLYFVRIEHGGRIETARIVRLR